MCVITLLLMDAQAVLKTDPVMLGWACASANIVLIFVVVYLQLVRRRSAPVAATGETPSGRGQALGTKSSSGSSVGTEDTRSKRRKKSTFGNKVMGTKRSFSNRKDKAADTAVEGLELVAPEKKPENEGSGKDGGAAAAEEEGAPSKVKEPPSPLTPQTPHGFPGQGSSFRAGPMGPPRGPGMNMQGSPGMNMQGGPGMMGRGMPGMQFNNMGAPMNNVASLNPRGMPMMKVMAVNGFNAGISGNNGQFGQFGPPMGRGPPAMMMGRGPPGWNGGGLSAMNMGRSMPNPHMSQMNQGPMDPLSNSQRLVRNESNGTRVTNTGRRLSDAMAALAEVMPAAVRRLSVKVPAPLSANWLQELQHAESPRLAAQASAAQAGAADGESSDDESDAEGGAGDGGAADSGAADSGAAGADEAGTDGGSESAPAGDGEAPHDE